MPKPTLIINAVAYLSASYSSNLDSLAVNKLVKKDDIYSKRIILDIKNPKPI